MVLDGGAKTVNTNDAKRPGNLSISMNDYPVLFQRRFYRYCSRICPGFSKKRVLLGQSTVRGTKRRPGSLDRNILIMPPSKSQKKSSLIPATGAFSLAAEIKRRLRKHVSDLGFRQKNGMLQPGDVDKDRYRHLHREHRLQKLNQSTALLKRRWDHFEEFFADGNDVKPTRIKPRLELVESDSWQNDLFRLATLTWSVPVSQGFGRRMRYLVWDDHNDKLLGIFALTDPVFNLRARDNAIGWNSEDRRERLVNVLDAFVLGALPPYNQLLCGKMVASLIRSQEVVTDFKRKYRGNEGIISGKTKRPQLVAITTTSSLGRSSIYNRLKLGQRTYFEQIGFTEGYGHFQVPNDIFADMRTLLENSGHKYASGHKYGDGPNWRLRTIRRALGELGLSEEILKHNLKREIFLCRLAENTDAILRGDEKRPDYSTLLTVDQVAKLCRKRWIVPRAQRQSEYKLWKREWIREKLILGEGAEKPSEAIGARKCA